MTGTQETFDMEVPAKRVRSRSPMPNPSTDDSKNCGNRSQEGEKLKHTMDTFGSCSPMVTLPTDEHKSLGREMDSPKVEKLNAEKPFALRGNRTVATTVFDDDEDIICVAIIKNDWTDKDMEARYLEYCRIEKIPDYNCPGKKKCNTCRKCVPPGLLELWLKGPPEKSCDFVWTEEMVGKYKNFLLNDPVPLTQVCDGKDDDPWCHGCRDCLPEDLVNFFMKGPPDNINKSLWQGWMKYGCTQFRDIEQLENYQCPGRVVCYRCPECLPDGLLRLLRAGPTDNVA